MNKNSKGWIRQSFEHVLRLKPEQTQMVDGHYSNPLTHALYAAFKAGMDTRPGRGSYAIAELHNSVPRFQEGVTYEFKDLAVDAMRNHAYQTGAVCAVYQQINTYDPSWIRA